jgi:hypothetical protein
VAQPVLEVFMTRGRPLAGVLVAFAVAVVGLQAGDVSRQQADSFAKKVAIINQRGVVASPRPAPARTVVSESEVNSWFTYRAQELIPKGVTEPKLTIIGNGRVMGLATVDLDAVSKERASGSTFDLWNLVGGRVPVAVTGVLQTSAGRGRFELQSATLGGVPVPKALLQQLVSYYSRTAANPEGVRLDSPFQLPARIQQIEVAPGQAVVVQ